MFNINIIEHTDMNLLYLDDMKLWKFAEMAEQAKAKPHIGQVFHGNSTPKLSSSGALPSINLNLIMQNIIIQGPI